MGFPSNSPALWSAGERRDVFAAAVYRWARRHPLLLDSVLACMLLIPLAAASAYLAGRAGLVVAVCTLAPLALRRHCPGLILVWTLAMSVIQLVVVPIPLPANVAQALVVYSVAAHVRSVGARVFVLVAVLVGAVLAGFRWSTPPAYVQNSLEAAAVLAVWATLVWVIGNLVRGREENLLRLTAAVAELEAGQRQLERYVAQRERMTAAREIHDIVAHSLTVVIVQADGAAYAADNAETWHRTQAREALEVIGRTARSALAEVRTVVDVLRDVDTRDSGDDGRATAVELRWLVDSVRAAGLPVDLADDPEAFDTLPAQLRFVTVRVVQESLTNVLKHAGVSARAHVLVASGSDRLQVRVTDDGRGVDARAATTPGHGLDGMRERVHELGGRFSAGPGAVGGFEVQATIPIEPPAGERSAL
ncbi:sensor histidine kinase [Prescottella agglutinans]|uniref:sensor histidine kinase n=1 Tax=Prescottella agglutinans TaxID=1644129 RepID=UPI003D95450F